MRLHRLILKTGNFLLPWTLACVFATFAQAAAPVDFSARVDRNSISMDDSVSLKINVKIEGGGQASEPTFSAPDFTLINEFTGSSMESYYENGRFGARNTYQITKVLKPLKTGELKITDLQIRAGGQILKAPDITVVVTAGGSGTPPPRNYGGSGAGLRGSAKRTTARDVMVRAEIGKDHVYKGEQILVSYYLYSRVRVFNLQPEKYPGLDGFLKEELEMPMNQGRLQSERVVLDGVPYERALILRYGAYPLHDGKLKIDPIILKYNYYANRGSSALDDEDPFMNFFQQMAPSAGRIQSDTLTIEVLPLPEAGKPNSFTGGVGDFSVISAANKTDARTNEAIQLTVKVEGRGNVAAIGEPKVKWPDTVELYESKSRAKTNPSGVGEKIFEYLIIPRQPGSIALPGLEFSFYDPNKKEYYSRSTPAITLHVTGQAMPAPAPATNSATGVQSPPAPNTPQEISGLLPQNFTAKGFQGLPFWRWLYWGVSVAFLAFLGVLLYELYHRVQSTAQAFMQTRSKKQERQLEQLRTIAKNAVQNASWQEIHSAYEILADVVFEALENAHPIGVRSLPRAELSQLLVQEHNMPEALWTRFDRLLEFAEMVRFASSAGAVSESQARQQLGNWVNEASSLIRTLERTG